MMTAIILNTLLYMPIEDEFMYDGSAVWSWLQATGPHQQRYILSHQAGLMESPRTKWNRPKQNGIAHIQIESPITKWNRPEQNGIAQNKMESSITK